MEVEKLRLFQKFCFNCLDIYRKADCNYSVVNV